jgi:PAS domain S-box-containing protein
MKSIPVSSASLPLGRFGWRIWALALVFAATVGGGAWSYFKQQQAETRRATEEALASIADLKAQAIVAWMKERRGDAEVARSSLVVRNFLADPDDPNARDTLQKMIGVFRQAYDYDAIAIFDAQGSPRLVVPNDGLRLYAEIGDEVQTALRSREVVLLDLHRDRPTEPIHLSLLGPIGISPQTNQPANGALILVIDPRRFLYPLVQTWPGPSQTAETMLVRRESNDVLFLNELRHQKNTAMTLRLPIDSNARLPAVMAVQGLEGVFEGQDYRGDPVLAATRRIPGTPWFIVAKVDKEEIYAPLRKDAWLAATCFALILLSAVLGLGFLWRQQKLAFALRELAEHKRAEASERRFRTLIEESPVAIRISRTGKTLYANKKFLRQYGYTDVGEIVDHHIFEQWAPESRTMIEERTLQRNAGGEVSAEYEGVGQRKDGSQFPVLVAATEVELADGKALISFLADITERKQAEKKIHQLNAELEQRVSERTLELAATNQELEAFSYSVSHDLRAPLRHVNGFVDLLRQHAGGSLDAKSVRFMDVIAGSARKMSFLIDDLLAFSRTSRAAMRMDAVSLDELLHEVLEGIHAETKGRQIAWKISNLPEVRGDRAMLRQVMVNLIGNAVKYTRGRQQAEIEIGSESREGEAVVFVRDNGAGFDMRYVEKLFGVFQRLHSDEEFEGTGIGLALVRRIISRHGGRTWADGKVDAGATFWFSLPARQTERSPAGVRAG